ncbi:hypothetical protein NE237_023904 [Protea cynaroides]|uniref:Uncharacterized protein n=1 Tax=Protea cynaroides TaxID=273540 RepID=A0A9Q0K6H4_9MAGN|nr:hypothetical protein NE237_023904 [Protea cynaroides]
MTGVSGDPPSGVVPMSLATAMVSMVIASGDTSPPARSTNLGFNVEEAGMDTIMTRILSRIPNDECVDGDVYRRSPKVRFVLQQEGRRSSIGHDESDDDVSQEDKGEPVHF